MDENIGYVSGNTALLKTTDGGESFTDIYPNLVVDPDDDSTYYLKRTTIVSADEFYVTTTSNGVFHTTDGGANFTKFDGIDGGSDLIRIDNLALMVLGTSTKSRYSKDAGQTWENCYPGSSIWEIGGIMNDSIYALAKGKVFKIALNEVVYNVGIGNLAPVLNELSVRYDYGRVELISDNDEIDQCTLYSITGEVVAKYTPNSSRCVINTNALSSGIYVATSVVAGKVYINKLWIVK